MKLLKNNVNILQMFEFSDGAKSIKVLLDEGSVEPLTFVTNHLKEPFTLFEVSLVLSALEELNYKGTLTFVLEYLPYARADRKFEEGNPKNPQALFLEQLNNLWYFDEIIIHDPHSEKWYLSPKIKVKTQGEILKDFLKETPLVFDVLVFPDGGAGLKASDIKESLKDFNFLSIVCSKERSLKGKITNTVVPFNNEILELKKPRFLVLDDICDGGGTFIPLAKKLKETYPNISSLELYVTHGIFSKGLEPLKEHYDNVYSWNSRI